MAIKIFQTNCFQGFGIKSIRRRVLLASKEPAIEVNYVRVCSATDLEFDRIRIFVAVFT